jgi:hypothetical protein
MIDDLVAIVDRYWSSISQHPGPDFVAHLLHFLEAMRRDARTRAVLEDLAREEQESVERVADAKRVADRSLRELVAAMEQDHGGVLTTDGRDVSTNVLAYLDGTVTTREPLRQVINQVRASANGFVERVHQRVKVRLEAGEELDADLRRNVDAGRALQERVNRIDAAYSHAQRARRLDEVASAGSSLVQLERELHELHPGPDRLPRAREQDGSLHHLRNHFFERQPALMDDVGATTQSAPLRSRAAIVVEEICRRLGLERSLLALVNRYRQRVEWYEAYRLRQLTEQGQGPGHIEDRLTSTLAMFLFDHGLNPLTKPMIGPGQPDVLGTGGPFSFYVEAKQHAEGARSYLVQGFNQIWDMFDRVRGTRQEVREAFYVVFRRGGPRYQFPDRVANDGRVVFPVVINIAEMSESGVNAPSPIRIDESDLRPAVTRNPVAPNADQS